MWNMNRIPSKNLAILKIHLYIIADLFLIILLRTSQYPSEHLEENEEDATKLIQLSWDMTELLTFIRCSIKLQHEIINFLLVCYINSLQWNVAKALFNIFFQVIFHLKTSHPLKISLLIYFNFHQIFMVNDAKDSLVQQQSPCQNKILKKGYNG